MKENFWIAILIAAVLDVIDLIGIGLIPIAADVIDIIGIIVLYPYIGIYSLMGFFELVPIIGDISPTFILSVVLARIFKRRTITRKGEA